MNSSAKRVVVTGAAGFVGSAVCRAALARDDDVFGLVRPGELVRSIPGAVYSDIDWNDPDGVVAAFRRTDPDVVIHCAGAAPRIGRDISAAYDANVRLIWQLFTALRDAGISPSVTILSSAAVYGLDPPKPTTEDAPPAPATHYAWSKLIAEEAVRSFVRLEGVYAAIARPFNLIGIGEPLGSVVSDVVMQLEQDPLRGQVTVRETRSVRDYLDVDDAARALLAIADHGVPGEAYNVCGGDGTSVAEIVRAILETWGSGAAVEASRPDDEGSVSVGSCDKLRALGWERGTDLRATLAKLRESRTRIVGG